LNTPLEILIAHYTSKANKNRKAIAASIYQDFVNYCTDLLQMERDYFLNGYMAGAEDMKKEITKQQDNDTSTNETPQEN
jgi:hypothetical protein